MSPSLTNINRSSYGKTITFDINDVDVGIVNSIRRVILSEIPNVGISFDTHDADKNDVNFIENTSSLHNEFMGHRLSMLPLHFNEMEIASHEPAKYKFVIKVQNTGTETIDVTTEDIVIMDEHDEMYPLAFHDAIFPKSDITGDPILITRLKPNNYNQAQGEKLHVEFVSRVAIAKEHSRFSPVSTCAFYNKVDDEKAKTALDEAIANAPKDKVVSIEKQFQIHDRFRHFSKNEYDEPNAFCFTIESECRLTPDSLFLKAIDVLTERLTNILEREDKYKVDLIDKDKNLYGITLLQEDHTTGNLLQVMMYKMYVRDTSKLQYVGYHLVHPLHSEIVLKIMFSEETTLQDVHSFLKDTIDAMNVELRSLKSICAKSFASVAKRIVRNKKT